MDAALQTQILETVDKLAQERVMPRAAEIDRSDAFPRDLYKAAGDLGLFGIWIPEEFGGTGPDFATPLLISERLARASASFALIYSNCGDACTPLVIGGSEALKRRFLPGIAAGEIIPAFCLSEPGGGSDAAAITTRAVRDGDHYVINGRKMWITNGSIAGVYTIFAKTDPVTGELQKKRFGPWMQTAMRWVARAKFLRGTAFDPFGRSAERRGERQLIADYEALIDELLAGLKADKLELAIELACLPETIRGYGHVKEKNLVAARARWSELLARWRGQAP